MKKDKRYPEGYRPKIEYWTGRYEAAVEADDTRAMVYAASKIEFFEGREAARV
jgi:hypothetical protein